MRIASLTHNSDHIKDYPTLRDARFDTSVNLDQILSELVIHPRVDIAGTTEDLRADLKAIGVQTDEQYAYLPQDINLLKDSSIRQFLSPISKDWLTTLEIPAAIDSTNTALVNRAQDSSIDGQVLTAEVQTAGRGRRGRQWHGAFGRNIAMSLGLRLDCEPTAVGSVSLVVGLAAAKVLEQVCDVEVGLKWPNDMLIENSKVGGILIELVRVTTPVEVVIGVGVNVAEAPHVDAPGALASTSLGDLSGFADRNQLVALLINNIVEHCREFELSGFANFREQWKTRDAFRGQRVAVEGSVNIVGVAQGISDDGALLVHTERGVERVIGGDVSLRSAAE